MIANGHFHFFMELHFLKNSADRRHCIKFSKKCQHNLRFPFYYTSYNSLEGRTLASIAGLYPHCVGLFYEGGRTGLGFFLATVL